MSAWMVIHVIGEISNQINFHSKIWATTKHYKTEIALGYFYINGAIQSDEEEKENKQ